MLITSIIICAVIAIALLVSKRPSTKWRTSTVSKGKHDFDFDALTGITLARQVKVHAKFSNISRYWLPDADQADWNKAPGFLTNMNPHINSARVGWRYNPNKDKFELSYYVRFADKTSMHAGGRFCMEVEPDEEFWYKITDKGDNWLYEFSNEISYQIPKAQTKPPYKLSGWYFGGNNPAPTDIAVKWRLEK